MLLSSSSLVVVVAAVVVVVRRRHDERDDYVRLETTHSAHVYYELRRREKMRPKNAAINLEPIPEREREKRGKKIRAFCVTKERITVYILCVASTTFARTTTQNRETVKVVADPSSSFSSFSAAGPRLVSLKFVRSLAFSLDVINYPL